MGDFLDAVPWAGVEAVVGDVGLRLESDADVFDGAGEGAVGDSGEGAG